ncbi:hypothetical protein GCM10025876_27170 [Demequina litorisediminis]|uniref:ChlI/MoxR AAA lid domain-containing protein n=1 Tax=Demequina litorisediminis TaxID=1849022 RepID=A0ABQ6IIG2_9MICO|nr:hypothetical protein GCM10025876_27170 [Demequina litorisediminis]
MVRRHAAGFDPRDLDAAGVQTVASIDDLAAARAEVATVTLSDEVAGYIVDVCRATREAASVAVGVSPRGAAALMKTARAWAWMRGSTFVTPDDVKTLVEWTLAHRIQLRAEAEPGGGHHPRGAGLRARLRPRTALSMYITGWTALLAALGAVPAVWSSGRTFAWVWVLSVLALAAIDAWLAPRATQVGVRRTAPGAVRLTESTHATLEVANLGRRRMRLTVRDAWQPSAGADDTRHRLRLAGGESMRLTTGLTPTRRGDRQADKVTVRVAGPLHLAGRQRSIEASGHLRVLPEFASRRHLPSRLARLREIDGQTAVQAQGRGQRVRLATRVRHRGRRPLDRLAGFCPSRRRPGAYLPSRTRPPGAHRARHLPHVGRPRGRFPSARRVHRGHAAPDGASLPRG